MADAIVRRDSVATFAASWRVRKTGGFARSTDVELLIILRYLSISFGMAKTFLRLTPTCTTLDVSHADVLCTPQKPRKDTTSILSQKQEKKQTEATKGQQDRNNRK